MPAPHTRSSPRGILLVEAVLAAIVIAVGLVFISRGLSNQLKAIRTVEEHEAVLAVARQPLAEREAARLFKRSAPSELTGTVEAAEGTSRWTMAVSPREDLVDAEGVSVASEVTLTAAREATPSSVATLGAIWPRDWVE